MRRLFFNSAGRLRSGWRLLLFVLSLATAAILAALVARLLRLSPQRASGVIQPVPMFVTGLLVIGVVLGVLWLIFRFVERRRLATMGIPLGGPWLKGLGAGLLLGATPVSLLVLILLICGYATVRPATIDGAGFMVNWVALAIGVALVSAWEELVLRGYGLQLLAEGLGRWPAALITGTLFGLAHVGNPGANALGVINTVANAVLLAWLVMLSGSLWIAIGYHAGWNLTAAVLFGMRLSGTAHSYSLLQTELAGPDWLSGGSYGFEGSMLMGVIEFVVMCCAVAMVNRLPGHPEMRPFFQSFKPAR
jgi:uncharacterized protein